MLYCECQGFLRSLKHDELTLECSDSLLLTWIFWTGGAAAITAELGGGLNCKYVHHSFYSSSH